MRGLAPGPVREGLGQPLEIGATRSVTYRRVLLYDRGEVPICVSASTTGELFIARHYLQELEFDSRGKVVIRGVPVMGSTALRIAEA